MPPPQSESSKEQFRKYLESAGAIDAMVKGESQTGQGARPFRRHKFNFEGRRSHGAIADYAPHAVWFHGMARSLHWPSIAPQCRALIRTAAMVCYHATPYPQMGVQPRTGGERWYSGAAVHALLPMHGRAWVSLDPHRRDWTLEPHGPQHAVVPSASSIRTQSSLTHLLSPSSLSSSPTTLPSAPPLPSPPSQFSCPCMKSPTNPSRPWTTSSPHLEAPHPPSTRRWWHSATHCSRRWCSTEGRLRV